MNNKELNRCFRAVKRFDEPFFALHKIITAKESKKSLTPVTQRAWLQIQKFNILCQREIN